jgi:hypothetical protein
MQQLRSPSAKYPFVGPRYQGEVTGYIYHPWTDTYYLDPKAQKKWQEDSGVSEPEKKAPGLGSQILPIATIAGATALGNAAIKDPGELLKIPGKIVGAGKDAAKSIGDLIGTDTVAGTASVPGTSLGAAGGANTPIASSIQATDFGAGMQSSNAGTVTAGGEVLPQTAGSAGTVPGTSFGQIAQGGLGVIQTGQGLSQIRDGNYALGGLNTVGGMGNLAAATGYNGIGAQTLGAAMPGINAALGAYQGYQTAKMIGNAPSGGRRNAQGAIGGASAGAQIGTAILPGVGTAIGAVIGGFTGLAGSLTGSSKGFRQMYRDSVRKSLKENGIIDDKYQGSLADGSTYDFGQDGSGIKVDYKDPVAGRVIGLTNVLSAVEGSTGKGQEATSELYASGALSNAGGNYDKARQNVQHFVQQRGIDKASAVAQLQKMKDAGEIPEEKFNAYMNGVNELYG